MHYLERPTQLYSFPPTIIFFFYKLTHYLFYRYIYSSWHLIYGCVVDLAEFTFRYCFRKGCFVSCVEAVHMWGCIPDAVSLQWSALFLKLFPTTFTYIPVTRQPQPRKKNTTVRISRCYIINFVKHLFYMVWFCAGSQFNVSHHVPLLYKAT